MEKKDKRKKILKVSGLIGLFLIVFGLSYALFQITLNGTKKVKIKTGKLELQLLDSNNNPIYITDGNNTTSYEINLDEQVPVSDDVGLNSTAFEFKLKNTGNIKASYTIYLDDVALESGESRIDDQYIRYSLTKNGSEENPRGLSSRELDKGTIEADNTTNEYTLKIWIAEDADNAAMDKVFSATLRVEGTQYVPSQYGVEIASAQLSETITATYYQPEGTGYNSKNKVKRMSNVKRIDNEEIYYGGTLVISGSGEIPEDGGTLFLADVTSTDDLLHADDKGILDSEGDFYKLKYNPESIIIENGIKKIGGWAFSGVPVSSIILSPTVEELGTCALCYTKISSIDLPKGLKVVGDAAFEGCKQLQTLRFPNTVTTIEGGAFSYCYNLKEVYLPGSVTYIGYAESEPYHIEKLYCETQEVADLLQGSHYYQSNNGAQLIVDPTKFE